MNFPNLHFLQLFFWKATIYLTWTKLIEEPVCHNFVSVFRIESIIKQVPLGLAQLQSIGTCSSIDFQSKLGPFSGL